MEFFRWDLCDFVIFKYMFWKFIFFFLIGFVMVSFVNLTLFGVICGNRILIEGLFLLD